MLWSLCNAFKLLVEEFCWTWIFSNKTFCLSSKRLHPLNYWNTGLLQTISWLHSCNIIAGYTTKVQRLDAASAVSPLGDGIDSMAAWLKKSFFSFHTSNNCIYGFKTFSHWHTYWNLCIYIYILIFNVKAKKKSTKYSFSLEQILKVHWAKQPSVTTGQSVGRNRQCVWGVFIVPPSSPSHTKTEK